MVVKRTKAEWSEIMNTYKKSGQTMAAWCRENGVNAKTLGAHMNAEKKNRRSSRTLEEWKILSEAQKSSGLGLSDWCKANGINENTMWSAESRLAQSRQSKAKVSEQESESSTVKSSWVEVKVLEPEPAMPSSMVPTEITDVPPVGLSLAATLPSGVDNNVACVTKSTVLTSESAKIKDMPANMRIRLKNLEVEVNNEYPVEKLMILVKELVNLC